ncbi:MAG: asparagine synthase (glutamine-hydrolyzing) [Gemmatimonadaceae bacterium]
MCGLVGVLRSGREIDRGAVERARDTLAHRGPDGAGLWSGVSRDGALRVALGHRRLSILDLSERGAQPLLLQERGGARPARRNEEGGARLSLVFNGEIYNFVELRDELRGLGHGFTSDCDTEVLLAAYAQWGADALPRLNGMFAFAIWDAERSELFCARDRFGEKPFYYVLDERAGFFAFASEVKALIAGGLALPELDERAVYRYFRFGEQAGVETTIWRGVRKLLPSHSLTVRASGRGLAAHAERYWEPGDAPPLALSEGAAAARFAELFADSVRIRLRSDVAVGTSLSGGLDSSSVACQIHRLGAAAGQKAFTSRADEPALDEFKYAEIVLRHTGIEGHTVTPTADDLVAQFDRLFYHQEEPFPTASIFASFLVHRLAREHGVTVMLDGQGADEYLAGYSHYPALVLLDLARRGELRRWWRERAALATRRAVDPIPPRAALHHWLAGKQVLAAGEPLDASLDASHLSADLHVEFGSDVSRPMAAGRNALDARLRADLTMGHLQELLRYADRNSMAFSREVRLPFLDHRLIELALSVPTEYLYSLAESKRLLRRAMRGIVPDVILDRSDKIGFATPWESWWSGRCGPALRERLLESERALPHLVRPGIARPGSAAALGVMALAAARQQMARIAPPARAA